MKGTLKLCPTALRAWCGKLPCRCSRTVTKAVFTLLLADRPDWLALHMTLCRAAEALPAVTTAVLPFGLLFPQAHDASRQWLRYQVVRPIDAVNYFSEKQLERELEEMKEQLASLETETPRDTVMALPPIKK